MTTPPPRTCVLPDGRLLAFDDVGRRAGRPVVYLHGTPDCRLARHPDDDLAADAGIRLLAVDRPGFGGSSPAPAAGLSDLGHDLEVLLDRLGIGEVGVLGWSAGGLAALGAATALGDRVRSLVLVGTVAPTEAHDDPEVLAGLGPVRRAFVAMAAELLEEGAGAPEVAAEVAQHLVPEPLDHGAALAHVLEGAGEVGRAELDGVPGAAEVLAAALVEAVAAGRGGLADDLARQLEHGLDLGAVTAPVRTVHGEHDPVSPPALGRWLADRLPRATAVTVPGAGHHLLLTRWAELLAQTAP